jgi:L-ascorbate metabolism protein UlaG (beta-lactamase superfamily)
MKITKLEQSGFIVESEDSSAVPGLPPFRLMFDIGRMTPIEKIKDEKPADAFLISHIHGDHFSPEHILAMSPKNLYLNSECKKNADDTGVHFTFPVELIKAGDIKQIGPFNVTFFAVDHGPNISAPVENLGFLIEENIRGADGAAPRVEKTYFSGDMFYAPGASADEQNNVFSVGELEVDTALIPVGTFYTFGPQEALEFANSFKKIGKIIPMHYEKQPQTNGEFRKLCEGKFECA